MVFSSVIFLFFFLPLAWSAYYLSWGKTRNLVLVLASFVFYSWGDRQHFLFLPGILLINYGIGMLLAWTESGVHKENRAPVLRILCLTWNPKKFKAWVLSAGIIINLGILISYKYLVFISSNIVLLFSSHNSTNSTNIIPENIAAPLGISFLTFHCLSYLIDIARSKATAQKNPLNLALYITVFPKLLAGPILLYHQASSQLDNRCTSQQDFAMGIRRFIIGMSKKVLIATRLGAVADKIFAIPGAGMSADIAWLGILCFSLQIYFDFSGYTDMAIGLGKTIGFHFPENFNYPYISRSVQEFWRRWHITLSNWFRDYLYIPLGGNRCSPARNYLNLIIVFFLCGLWHGASWNFVVWGLWYGLFLIMERRRFGRWLHSAPLLLQHIYALFVILVGWVLFRAESLQYACQYLSAMIGLQNETLSGYSLDMFVNSEVVLCLSFAILGTFPLIPTAKSFFHGRMEAVHGIGRHFSWSISAMQMVVLSFIFLLSCMAIAGGTHTPFIYFKF